MKTEKLKATALAEIDQRAESLIGLAKTVLEHPEAGFRERKTSRRVAAELEKLGIPLERDIAITGLKGTLEGGTSGPTVAVIGELDSLVVPDHPHADPATGAAHACAHHVQLGSMLGVASGLAAVGVMEALAGRVVFIAVPAEEFIEIEYRDRLRREGKLEFLGGKSEFIRLGVMDDVDMAMMTHTENIAHIGAGSLGVGAFSNGMLAKRIQFKGLASHAGAWPYKGINALNAANIALAAIHAQRETFRDEDAIKVHPIITKGGTAVSSVPADVRMETFVRGKTTEAFQSAAQKVDRALRAGAMAVGASVTITTLPGYVPLRQSSALTELYVANAAQLVGEQGVFRMGHRSGSTDMGDIGALMPVLHPYVGSANGNAHGADYLVEDYGAAVVSAAKAMTTTVIDLLADRGRRAQEVIAQYDTPMSKAQYLSMMRNMLSEETYTE